MPTKKVVKEIKNEIKKLEKKIARLTLNLERIQSRCKHEKTKKVGTSKTLIYCIDCHKVIVTPPTTSVFPPSAFDHKR